MPGCKLMGWLGIGLGLCQRRSNGGGTPTPTPSVSTPVISQESASHAAPFEFSWTDDPTILDGYYAEVARTTGANTAAASAALIAATPNGSDPTLASLNGHDIHQLTLDDLSSSADTVFSGLTATPTGVPLALRMRFGHEDGSGGYVWGNWSNVLTDDIASVNALVMVQEVDSITAWPTNGHADLWTAAHPTWTVHKQAATGNGIANLISRRTANRAYDAQVVTILCGANDDITATGPYGSTTGYFNALMAEVALYRSDGAKVVVGTLMPQGAPQGTAFNPARLTFNSLLKAALGTQVDAIADYDATPLGNPANADNPIYFNDYVHPTDGTGTPTSNGQGLYMYPQYTGAVNYALGIANEVKQFTFTDNGSAAASTVTASNAVTMIGLGYSETKAYSVSSGHDVRKNGGSWVTNGSGTVTNGDTLEVRATSSGTGGGTVNVVLTVGTVTDTFTITTASAGVAVAYVGGAAKNDGFGTPTNFTGITTTTGKKHVIMLWSDGGANPSAVSLDGTAMTKKAAQLDSTIGTSCWECVITTGGSGKALAITQGSAYANAYAMWTVDSTATYVSSVAKANATANDPQVTASSISIPSGGVVFIGVGCRSAVTFTGNSGTSIDGQYADATEPAKFAAARLTASGAPSLNGAAFSEVQMLAVSYQP